MLSVFKCVWNCVEVIKNKDKYAFLFVSILT